MDNRGPAIGSFADDLTGAADLAGTLVRQGLRTELRLGVPDAEVDAGDVEAVIIALKSRTAPVAIAVKDSLAAAHWLINQRCQRLYFKYCSTFDSTPQGNIGPVADAVLDLLGERHAVVVAPAFPRNGRTVYQGHLFVGPDLLSDSSMRNHPLTPMLDSSVVRLLATQSRRGVELIDLPTVRAGADRIRREVDRISARGVHYAVVDSVEDGDLTAVAAAVLGDRFVTGGSALAGAMARILTNGDRGTAAPLLAAASGPIAVLAGSCSTTTRAQVQRWKHQYPAFAIDARDLLRGDEVIDDALAWARSIPRSEPVLIYSSAFPKQVSQSRLASGGLIAEQMEETMGRIARGLCSQGVRQFVVAGGETSGAVARALGATVFDVGPEIEPGIPVVVDQRTGLRMVFKSGSFGSEKFLVSAVAALSETDPP